MEFLKEILGEELYSQVESKINEYNGADANREKQIKLANLGSGEYVGKGKFDSLSADLASKQSELEKANSLIGEMKKASKGNEDMQVKIAEYEKTVAGLQAQLAETQLKAAVETALHRENAVDVDYLSFKLNEKLKANGETLELDDNGKVKGWESRIEELKTAYPNMFASQGKDGYTPIGDNRLPEVDKGGGYTKTELLKKPYAERAKIYNENPEAYKEIMKS